MLRMGNCLSQFGIVHIQCKEGCAFLPTGLLWPEHVPSPPQSCTAVILLWAGPQYHILTGNETTEMLQIADTVKRLWFIGLLFLQKRHECLILSSVSHYANWEGDRWFKRWGIEVFNLQASISGSAWVRAVVEPYCLASSPVSPGFFIHVTGLSLLINMQLRNFSNDKSQCQYEIYFFKNKDIFLSWQQCKTGTAGSLCFCCLLRIRVCYPELLGWNLLLVSCNK